MSKKSQHLLAAWRAKGQEKVTKPATQQQKQKQTHIAKFVQNN